LLIPAKRRFELHLSTLRKAGGGLADHVLDTLIERLSDRVKIPRARVRTFQHMGGESKQSFLEHRISRGQSFQICPLWNQDQWVGALYVGSTRRNAFEEAMQNQMSSIAHQTCVSLLNARLYEEIKENHLRTIKALAIAVDAKDKYTRGHSENVTKYAVAITEEMGILDPKISSDIQNAALLHDIGKIGIPGHILNKPGKLTAEEFNTVMKNHVQVGANIIQEIPFLHDLVPLILHHHERYDGNGYPRQLHADEIPVGARILAVADSFEAMTSNRPYRKALSQKEAVGQLVANKGTQFDPYIVDTFLSVLEKKFPAPPEEKG
jgi:putative nucleotidyltransferase with HDIG domain